MAKGNPTTRTITIAVPYVYGAQVILKRTGPDQTYNGFTDDHGNFVVEKYPISNEAINLFINANGYKSFSVVLQTPTNKDVFVIGKWPISGDLPADWIEILPGLVKNFPAIPSREQVCGINIQFQGRIVVVDGVKYPWFPTALQCLTTAQRMQVYPQLAGDTHCFVEFLPAESIYNEPGQPYQNFISPDFESNPLAFRSLVEEIRLNGYQVGVIFNGDNGDNPIDGYPNALRQLPILVNLMEASQYRDLNQDVLYLRLWDGVFYGSTPGNIQNFGTQFRKLNPSGYLQIQHNPGHIPVGGGERDWQAGGAMDGYDGLLSEYNSSFPFDDTTWQVVPRCVTPSHRPPDQPANDDPDPPFYLVDSPRGKRFYCAFEFGAHNGEYNWVRVDTNDLYSLQSGIQKTRDYYKALGCLYTG